MAVLLNPPAARLGVENAILWGRGRRDYHVREFPGPLSIKAVLRGAAEWTVGNARFEVDSNSYLVLNHGQPYSITVEAPEPVETFCIFFARGFVEDAWRSLTTADSRLLDDPAREASIGFYERLRPCDARISAVIEEIHRGIENADGLLYRLALGLIGLQDDLAREIGRVPAARASTREELHRRLHRGKQALDEGFASSLTLEQIARAAHLSPFHFHRTFTAAFGETPHAYRTRRRLEKAARLLGETEQSVTEVCLEAGFESPTSFAALFRKRFGWSPAKFARSKRQRNTS